MMFKDHPTAEDLEGFLRNPSHPDRRAQNARTIDHLLANCPTCRDQWAAMGWPGQRLESLVHLTERPALPGYDYTQSFARAEGAISEFLAVTPQPAHAVTPLLVELDGTPADEQESLLAKDERFVSPQVVKQLIDRCHRARYEDPERMLHWARLAHGLAMRCDEEAAGNARKLADLRARSSSQWGNALRVTGRLEEAREAMAQAQESLQMGTGDPALRALLQEQKASLHTFERSFAAAIRILDEAAVTYRELGENHLLARTLIQQAIASLYGGEPENSIALLNRAIPLIDQEVDPHLLLAACHNIVHGYIDLDQPEQALKLYFESRELYKEFKDALILLRASWQEGQLLRDLGHLEASRTALLAARQGFLERGLAYEVAVVSLDLSSVYVKLGAVEEVRRTVAETMPTFRSLRVGRDALAALLQLQQVADQEHQALALIREITARLERFHRKPPQL